MNTFFDYVDIGADFVASLIGEVPMTIICTFIALPVLLPFAVIGWIANKTGYQE